MDACIECQAGDSTQECVAAFGACNHAFHAHCMTKWLVERNVCPLDNREWVLVRTGR